MRPSPSCHPEIYPEILPRNYCHPEIYTIYPIVQPILKPIRRTSLPGSNFKDESVIRRHPDTRSMIGDTRGHSCGLEEHSYFTGL